MSETKDINSATSPSSPSLLAQAPAHVAKVSYEYEGVIQPKNFSPRCFHHLKNLKLRQDDLFVITYAKSGTTWAQQLAVLVKYDGNISSLEGKFIMKIVPFLESLNYDYDRPLEEQYDTVETFCEVADAMPTDSLRILKTHAVPKLLPDNVRSDPKVKVIYVARNPKDTAVSLYHFCHYTPDLPPYTSWDEFFEEFIADRAPMGSWFDHNLHWWELRNHPNVLFLTYEGMKQDPRKAVVQIADFMGKSLSDDIIDKILEVSTFDAMKKSPFSNPDIEYKNTVDTSDNKSFFRKGAVGDWKNYFTEDQNRRFDKLYKEKVADSGLELIFEF